MLTRWFPKELGTSLFGRFDNEMDRFFDRVDGPFANFFRGENQFLPSLDLREKNDEYVLTADVPGLERDEVEVDVQGDVLTLRGHHKEEHEDGGGTYHCQERREGYFERALKLPGEVRVDDVRAVMKNGVLTVHLPKTAASQTRRIEVTEH